MERHARQRGGSFHILDNHGKSINPNPEPLDISSVHPETHEIIDETITFPESSESENTDDVSDEWERFQGRGRSRSRSVHDYNEAQSDSSDPPLPQPYNPNEYRNNNEEEDDDDCEKTLEEKERGERPNIPTGERTGPLQHREVMALQKGLEEATHSSINPQFNREEEEEKIAAESEKRKRILAAAHLSSSNEPVRRIKVLLLGDSGVGKSSLILRWTQDTFSPSLVSTVGVNFKSKKITFRNELIQVQVWDTAGQEQFHKITTSYYKGAQGILLIYDVSEPKSLQNIEYWVKNIKSHASDSVQVALVANKIDLRQTTNSNQQHADANKCVEIEKGREIAHKYGVPFYETSAKDSLYVDEAFTNLVSQIYDTTIVNKHIIVQRSSLTGTIDKKLLEKSTNIPQNNITNNQPNVSVENPRESKETNGKSKDSKEKCIIS